MFEWCEKFSPPCSDHELTRFEGQIFPVASGAVVTFITICAFLYTVRVPFKNYQIVPTDIARFITLSFQTIGAFVPALAMQVWDDTFSWSVSGILFTTFFLFALNFIEYSKGVNLTWFTASASVISLILITLSAVNAIGSLMSGTGYVSYQRVTLIINWLLSIFSTVAFSCLYPFRGELSFYVDPLYQEYIEAKRSGTKLTDTGNEEDDSNISAELADPPITPPLPNEKIGLLSLFFYSWINPMMSLGSRKPLKVRHLYQLPKQLNPGRIEEEFERAWAEACLAEPDPSKRSLSKIVWRTYRSKFIVSGIMKFIYDCMQYISPIILRFILSNMGDGTDPNKRGRGIMLAVLLFVNQSIMSLLLHQYWNKMYILGMELRSAVTTGVFNKSLRINSKASPNESGGAMSSSTGQYIALISVDAQRLQDFTAYVHVCWSGPFQAVAGLIFVLVILGYSALSGVAVLLISIPLLKILMGRYQMAKRQVMTIKSERLKFISELMQGIKIVKLYAWERTFRDRIEKTRAKELAVMWKYRMAKAMSEAPLTVISMLVCVASFGTYIGSGHILDSATAFTAVLVFDLLKFPMFMIPNAFMMLIEAGVAMGRVQKFLELPEVEPRPFTPCSGTANEQLIQVSKRNFYWNIPNEDSLNSKPFLIDASFTCTRGSLTAIVGPTGSGKSGLIQGLLSEVYHRSSLLEGEEENNVDSSCMILKGKVGLASQTPWIQHGTLKNNILFNKEFNPQRYAEVLRVCALETDIELLPAGDETEIGEKGINLSGGQKARVSLARVVYAADELDVIILDDVLSAVDAHVSEHIFHECMKGSLLKNQAIILVTHNIHLLPSCDLIIVLGGSASRKDMGDRDVIDPTKGRIMFTGSYEKATKNSDTMRLLSSVAKEEEDLAAKQQEEQGISRTNSQIKHTQSKSSSIMNQNHISKNKSEDFASKRLSAAEMMDDSLFDNLRVDDSDSDNDDDKKSSKLNKVSPSLSNEPLTSAMTDQVPDSATLAIHSKISNDQQQYNADEEEEDDLRDREDQRKAGRLLVHQEKASEGAVAEQVYKAYFWDSAGPLLMILVFLGTAGNQGMNIFGKTHLSSLSDETEQKKQLIHLAWYAGAGIVSLLCVCMEYYMAAAAAQRGARLFHHKLLAKIIRAPIRFFDSTPVGRILNRFSKDTDTIDDTLSASGMSWLEMCSQVIATIVAVSMVMPWFLIALLPLGILFKLSQSFFIASSRQLKRIESLLRSPVISFFGETVQGLETVRAFNQQELFQVKNRMKLDWALRGYFLSIATNRWLGMRNEFVGTFATAVASLLVVLMTGNSSSSVSASAAGLALSYSLSVSQQLNWMVRMFCEIETNIVSVERVLEYSECPQERRADTPIDDSDPRVIKALNDGWPKQGAIAVKTASLRYAPELPRVLRNLTINIEPGERVGLVGRTGAGKSTLLLALLRLVELDQTGKKRGVVEIDGIDVSHVGLDDLRSRVSVIPQDPVMFNGTVRFNLDPFDSYSDDDVIGVIRRVHLDQKVVSMTNETALTDENLKKGLQAAVTEGGGNFSLGERQLLCMGRALLRKSKIILLDEATSAVDFETDAKLQTTLRESFSDSTLITIAHRINTIIDYDKVLVLDKGKKVEFDSPESLLKKKDSLFRSLAVQAGLIEDRIDGIIKMTAAAGGSSPGKGKQL